MDYEFGPEQTVTDSVAGAQEVPGWTSVITEGCSRGSNLITKRICN